MHSHINLAKNCLIVFFVCIESRKRTLQKVTGLMRKQHINLDS